MQNKKHSVFIGLTLFALLNGCASTQVTDPMDPWENWNRKVQSFNDTIDENAIGASKFYRRECFEEINGFIRQVMWDGIDGHRCRQLGWIAISWDDPELRFTHLRPMGSSQKNIVTGRIRHGFGQYFMGTGIF